MFYFHAVPEVRKAVLQGVSDAGALLDVDELPAEASALVRIGLRDPFPCVRAGALLSLSLFQLQPDFEGRPAASRGLCKEKGNIPGQ